MRCERARRDERNRDVERDGVVSGGPMYRLGQGGEGRREEGRGRRGMKERRGGRGEDGEGRGGERGTGGGRGNYR